MFVVLTKIQFAPEQKETVVELSRDSAEIAKQQPGFIGIRTHLAHGDNHSMTYWEWETEQDHLNCTTSDDWAEYTPKWQALMENGAKFELDTYDLVVSS
ncbi:MAG: hypothetical protein GKR90_25270 [Pseudomonadales bacterium]|nr:hypothetical protein [Pseudomonadales bacterium]